MDTTLHPSSPAQTLQLDAGAAARLLRLRARQHCWLRVDSGRLWLTQDGLPDDQVLASGARLRLQGPGRFRCSAFGPEAMVLVVEPPAA